MTDLIRSEREYRRLNALAERARFNAMLAEGLAKLSAEVDKAAAALDRPGGRAIPNRLVKATSWVVQTHRMAGEHQATLDELEGTERQPARIIDFPKARITQLRVVDEPAPGIAMAIRACGRSPVRLAGDTEGGGDAA